MLGRCCKNCNRNEGGRCRALKKPVAPGDGKKCLRFRPSKEYLRREDDEESEMEDLDRYDQR